jgi:hypothetical protein
MEASLRGLRQVVFRGSANEIVGENKNPLRLNDDASSHQVLGRRLDSLNGLAL